MDVLLFLSLAGQLGQLLKGQEKLMATVQEMADAVRALKDAVGQFPQVIDALEAKITEALKNTGMSDADKALVTQAFDDAKAATTQLGAVKADAEDGVDEGDTGGGTVPPVNPV